MSLHRSISDRKQLRRRDVLELLLFVTGVAGGVAGGALVGCGLPPSRDERLDAPLPDAPLPAAHGNVRALMNVLLPAERDARGVLTSPGALEVGALSLLQLGRFIPLAQAQGLLPSLPAPLVSAVEGVDPVLVAFIGAELDAMAVEHGAIGSFQDLDVHTQEQIVTAAFDDAERRPVMEVVRGVCFLAYLGAITTDAGLVDVGYPPFEDFAAGIACSGYPATVNGVVEDYTYNERPPLTPNDDLSAVLDATGNLL